MIAKPTTNQAPIFQTKVVDGEKRLIIQRDENVDITVSEGYKKLLKTYIKEATKPLNPLGPKDTELTWTISKDSYSLELGKELKLDHIIYPVDFSEIQSAQVKLFVATEAKDVQSDPEDPLEINYERMKWMLRNVFTQYPRNHEVDKDWKEAIVAYLFQKFGSLGYLTILQSFKPRQFKETVETF